MMDSQDSRIERLEPEEMTVTVAITGAGTVHAGAVTALLPVSVSVG
jgi:hypothetical protein